MIERLLHTLAEIRAIYEDETEVGFQSLLIKTHLEIKDVGCDTAAVKAEDAWLGGGHGVFLVF